MMPTQNCGMPWPTRVKARTAVVPDRPGAEAAIAASGTLITSASTSAYASNDIVIGTASATSCGDRPLVGDARAEVAPGQVAEEEQVLVPQRPVEAELVAQRRHAIGRGRLAQDRQRGVAGQQVDHEEHDDGDAEDHRDGLEDPERDEAEPVEHASPPFSCGVSAARGAGRRRGVRRRPAREVTSLSETSSRW